MNLVIDLGNTTHKAAFFSEGELIDTFQSSEISIPDLQSFIGEKQIAKWIISSVEQEPDAFIDYLKNYAPGIYFNHSTSIPIQNQYQTPETLGKDRLANMIAARKLFPDKNVLVIDAGTCIKYDFISQKGNYSGGAISPGLAIRFQGMHYYTARLPLITKESIPEMDILPITGTSTISAMLAGGAQGAIFEIEGFIDAYEKNNNDLTLVITGGDASFFVSRLKNRIFAIPNLTLIGLNTVLEYNSRNI